MRDLMFSVAGEGKQWPATTTVELSDGRTVWQWAFAAAHVRRTQVLRLLPGEYRFAFSAPGHQRLERTVNVGPAASPLDLGAVVLRPVRIVSGSVIDPDRRPVAGCAVLADGVALGFTDARGRFAAELPTPAPRTVVLSHPGYAPRLMTLPGDRDAVLGAIQLTRGGSIACTIDRQHIGLGAKVSATLFELVEGDTFRRRDSASLDAEQTLITFTRLDAGEYAILLEGSAPGEQMAVPVKVSDSATSEVLVTIAPWRLEVTVKHGDEPLSGGTVRLLSSGSLERRVWNPEIRLDAEGRAAFDIWQRGLIYAEVRSPELQAVFTPPPLSLAFDDERGEWDIVIPRQRVHGVVVDDSSGEPLRGVRVIHDSDSVSGDTRTTDDDGRYAFDALHDGDHTFRVVSNDHLPAAPATVNVTGPTGERRLDFRLKKGKTIALQVRDAEGRALAAAIVIDGCAAASGRRGFRTDKDGMLALPSAGGRHSVCVLPMQGSFAVTDVAAPNDAQSATPQPPVQILVPAPAVTMRVVAKTTAGLAVAQLGVLFVYNGRVVPPPVVRTLAELQRRSHRTDARGELLLTGMPAGHYELFVFGGDEEADALAAQQRRTGAVYSGYVAPGEAVLEILIEGR
ncbi:MAG TPA: carboxypeptidase regulatory-like domain-containing protein [Thermoanaerobaculia bacterium]